MHDDKNFKELLSKGALEETSKGFTDEIMRRIEAAPVSETSHQPLINHKIKLAFIIVFVTVLSALIALSIFIPPSNLPFDFWIKIPSVRLADFYNLVYFIMAFWFVMFLNHHLNKRNLRNHGFN